MKKQKIRLSATKTAILISIICAVGALALAVSIIFSDGQPIPEKTVSTKDTTPLPPVPGSLPEAEKAPSPSEPPKAIETLAKPEKIPQKPREKPNKPDASPTIKPPTTAAKPPKKTPELPVKPEPVVSSGKLIIVFDDAGHNMRQLKKFVALPFPVTIAVLPGLEYSLEAAELIRKSGKELLLHQPMQAKNLSVNPGPGAILPHMNAQEAAAVVSANLAQIGQVSGLNNHEGSLITESPQLIGAVLDVCTAKNIYFLDSRTTAQSAAPQAAQERGLKITARDIFLDNSQERGEIEKMLAQGVKIAEKNGSAVLIGHVWSDELADILLEAYPVLRERGFTFTTISGLRQN